MLKFFLATIAVLALGYIFAKCFWLGSKKSKFRCLYCGKCCMDYRFIPIDEAAIKRLEKVGYKKADFLEGKSIRKVKGACFFLRKKKGKYHCAIYKIRPQNCKDYPFSKFLGGYITDRFNCPGIRKLGG